MPVLENTPLVYDGPTSTLSKHWMSPMMLMMGGGGCRSEDNPTMQSPAIQVYPQHKIILAASRAPSVPTGSGPHFLRRSLRANMMPARGPQTMILSNLCCAICVVQSLLCNLCCAIFVVQSLLCKDVIGTLGLGTLA